MQVYQRIYSGNVRLDLIVNMKFHVVNLFDFTGNGADEVITLGPGRIQIYGYANVSISSDRKQDPVYLQLRVANHTHY